MAFGKDPSQLNNMPSFGQGNLSQQAGVTNRDAGGGRRSSYWRDNFEISDNPSYPSRFRMLRGAYRQQHDVNGVLHEDTFSYWIFREHFDAVAKQGFICSAGPMFRSRNDRLPCRGCDKYWEEVELRKANKLSGGDGKKPRSISMTDKFGFTVFDYAYYFEVPRTDANGQIVMDQRNNKPRTNWLRALNPQDPSFAGYPWKEGDTRPWAVSTEFRDTITSWNLTVGRCCASCGARDSIRPYAWYCGNEACRAGIFDPNNTHLSIEEQEEITKKPYTCRTCAQTMFPFEHVTCSNCQQGVRATVFDVDLYGFRQSSGQSKGSSLIITGFGNPGPIVTHDPQAAAKAAPLDLAKHFQATPYAQQQGILSGGRRSGGGPAPVPTGWTPPPGGL